MPDLLAWLQRGGQASGTSLQDAMAVRRSPQPPMKNQSTFVTRNSVFGKAGGFCSACGDLGLEQVLMMKPAFWGSSILDLGPAHGKWTTNSCPLCKLLATMRPPLLLGRRWSHWHCMLSASHDIYGRSSRVAFYWPFFQHEMQESMLNNHQVIQ
jgi:hypothetical protein